MAPYFVLLSFLVLGAPGAQGSPGPIVVTGATGGTGSILYLTLKAKGVPVRALVRNYTKAKEILGCQKCDSSEGIFLGDATQKSSMTAVMQGAGGLAIVTSAMPICTPYPQCHYSKGAFPLDVDFNGGRAQIEVFAEAQKAAGVSPGPVVLCSAMGTTEPDSELDKLGNGFISFYKLNEEAFLMNSGIPFTIVKPCGLTNDPAGQKALLVGHDDDIKVSPPSVSRADVARVMLEALVQDEKARNLRFDLCSQAGDPTTDFGKLFDNARYSWQKAQAEISV